MSAIRKFLDMPNDNYKKTVVVALLLCFVCSIAVATAAVVLKPIQTANKLLDKKSNIIQIANLQEEGQTVEEIFQRIEAKVVDLQTGEYVDNINPATYDARAAAVDPQQNVVLKPSEDTASIKRHAQYATVYLVKSAQGEVQKIILPVYGYGLWSTLYGFIALQGDINTIVGLGFYEHAETPGLGGEVDNPNWKSQWVGKKVYDSEGDVEISVVKNAATEGEKAKYQVDAISGATLTSNGVDNLLHFWLGEKGFGPYLQKLRQGEGI